MNGRALAQFTRERNFYTMLLSNPAGNGQPQTCTADTSLRLGTGCIYAIKALKDLLLVFLGNADAVIR